MQLQKPFIQKNIDIMNNNPEVVVDVLRLDVIDEVISGNKWFKLRNYIAEAGKLNKKIILTFGGAYSNHIVATAATCNRLGFESIGIIRGEIPPVLSHTLVQAKANGMKLKFISREDFRKKQIPASVNAEECYVINEGGYGLPGAKGIEEMFYDFETKNYTDIFCAVGTGTMMAGLIKASETFQTVNGISVLKNFPGIKNEIESLLTEEEKTKSYNLLTDYHFKGYAKYSAELLDFMNIFFEKNHIPSDFVYTGKLFFAVSKISCLAKFNGKRLLIVHSGGLQGNLSLPKGALNF